MLVRPKRKAEENSLMKNAGLVVLFTIIGCVSQTRPTAIPASNLIVDSIDDISGKTTSWQDVEQGLKSIDGKQTSFVILDRGAAGYIQCAGTGAEYTVEIQKNGIHYRFGIDPSSSLERVVIACGVGPIYVKKEEVLSLAAAKELFRCYSNRDPFPKKYILRELDEKFD